eukprot:scaffold30989_cov33-Prasinocladus_malaysianus.AAC.1
MPSEGGVSDLSLIGLAVVGCVVSGKAWLAVAFRDHATGSLPKHAGCPGRLHIFVWAQAL